MSRVSRAPRALTALALGAGLTLAGVAEASAGPSVSPRATYIVVLDSGVDPDAAAARAARRHDGRVGHVYHHALNGYSIEVPPRAAAAIARSRGVAHVEADQVMRISDQTVPTGISRIGAPGNGNIDIDGSDDARVDVDVAVIDTGIDLDHPDLNVHAATDCTNESGGPPWSRTAECLSGGDDDNGHGTHVAGSAAALDNGIGVVGVAPGARLWAVKVLGANGSGSTTMVIAGIDHVAANADQIEVANLSLGGGFSQALNDAVANAVDAGVTMVVAAGNSSADAGGSSPASEPSAVTVSALADFDGAPGGHGAPTCRTDEDDTFANFSNYGSVVDIIAPGVCILSTVPGGYDTFSGTSMASPHVAGAAALLRSMGKSHATTVGDLLSTGNDGWDNGDDPDGIQEPLLDVSNTTVFDPVMTGDTGGGDPVNEPPTASFTVSCADLSCDVDGSGSTDDGTITSYVWDFGDGGSATGATASHTYAAAGTYQVTLTVTDDQDATDSHVEEVTVSDGSGGEPGEVTFTPSSVNNGSTWTAVISVAGGEPGTAYDGVWSHGSTAGGCTAASDGTCSFSLAGIPKRVGSVTWTLDGGSVQVTVSKP